MINRLTFLLLGLAIIACSPKHDANKIADIIYTNGKIYTVNEIQPWAEAVAIKDGKFLKVGTAEEVGTSQGEKTKVIDLEGKFVMPGMIDVHTHAIDTHVPAITRLSDSYDVDKMLAEIKAKVDANPDQEWFLFGDFGFGLFPGDNGPKELIDAVVSDKAIAIQHASGHAFWANSKALELAGITKDTPDPELGSIARKANGEPAGGLQETAMKMIFKAAPDYTPEQIAASVEYANKLYASHGITATREAGIVPKRFKVVADLAAQGKVKIRYSLAAHWQTSLIVVAPPNEEVRAFLFENKDKGTDMMKLDALKIYVDGVPASHTALLKEAYADRPDTKGILNIPVDDLKAALIDYDKNGIATIIHVLGDEATKLALDAVEAARIANGDSGILHHISHSIIIDESDIERYRDLGVGVDFSPFFAHPGEMHENHIKAVGKERFEKWYPVKSVMDQKIPVALATDYPVAELNPFVHMETAHTRRHPYGEAEGTHQVSEAISMEAALKAYTLNPARILQWDDKIGSIEEGKLADMVVLDSNPLEVEAVKINEIKVLQTVLTGEVIFDLNEEISFIENIENQRLLALANLKRSGHICANH